MKALLLVLLTLAQPVQAEVFKCIINKFNIVYQATPCVDAVAERKIDIKPRSAEAEAAAAASLKAWDAKYAAEQAAEDNALKAKKNKMPRRVVVEVVQRRSPMMRSRKRGRRAIF